MYENSSSKRTRNTAPVEHETALLSYGRWDIINRQSDRQPTLLSQPPQDEACVAYLKRLNASDRPCRCCALQEEGFRPINPQLPKQKQQQQKIENKLLFYTSPPGLETKGKPHNFLSPYIVLKVSIVEKDCKPAKQERERERASELLASTVRNQPNASRQPRVQHVDDSEKAVERSRQRDRVRWLSSFLAFWLESRVGGSSAQLQHSTS